MKKFEFQDADRTHYMDIGMVSDYLHVAKSTIYKWVGSGFIPYKKLGKPLLFIKKDIDQWVENDCIIKNDLPEIPKSIKGKDNGEIPLRA
jgi:excisionase family DNA binding protein